MAIETLFELLTEHGASARCFPTGWRQRVYAAPLRARVLAAVLLPVAVVACSRAAAAQARGASDRPCRDGGWSAAQAVRTANGDYVYVERPSIFPIGRSTAFIGTPTTTYDSTAQRVASWGRGPTRVPGALTDFAVGVVRLPDGRFEALHPPATLHRPMVFPQGLGDGRRAVVLWGSAVDASSKLGDVQEIYAAELDESGWSEPERIVAMLWLLWFRPGVDMTRAPDGTIHAVVSVGLANGGGVLHLSNAGGRWHADSAAWLAGRLRMYPQLEVLGASRFLLVFQGGAPDAAGPLSSRLYAARSDDGGRTWSEPIAVSDRSMEDAYEPRLFRHGAVVGVVWRQAAPERGPFGSAAAGAADSIRLSLSGDGGRSWQDAPPLVGADGITDLEAVPTEAGVLVAAHSPGAPARLSASWRAGRWHSFGTPQDPRDFTAPSLGRAADGRLVMAWGRWFRPDRRSVMVVSLLSPACAP